jgi:hypothetical protein
MRRPFDQARLAAVILTVGCAGAIAGSFLPWIQATDPEAGITLSKAGIDGHYALLVDLMAVISGGIAGTVLLRGSGPPPAAIVLTVLAVAELGLVIFVGSNLGRGVAQLEAAGATAGLGIGLYLTGLGAVIATAGGALMWMQSRRPIFVSDGRDSGNLKVE